MPAPPELKGLIRRFEDNWKQYSSQSYKEAELRKEFLNPMFEMLGWDIYNKKGRPEQYKEVVDEPSLEVEGGTKTPDYAFRLGEVTKFYVEAKKPYIKITTDPMPAFQLKRYAFSAKLPLSILTNFEDISIYDCRFKPEKTDSVTKGRILHIDFQELEERWDELANIFSPDAIWQGSFDKYVAKKKKGTTEVDVEILKDIEEWREELAKNIALRNNLNNEELNFAVQRLIDRILFLRICEDRGTEPENQLYNIMMNKKDIYRHMVDVFQLADVKYNSGLFHFMYDKKRKATKPDRISPFMKVDDKAVASIIWDLYYPNSPYQFDVISADILGQVYEQFLGKVIRLQPSGNRAVVEEKPEVKKSGGVYYTPTYIVEYIVENTVGKLCRDKSPEEMTHLKILDPACGSGSFLIVTYQCLLNEHLKWYEANKPKKHKEKVFLNQKGIWQLTLHEKKRILLNNIHGVDIDSQAVEVTKLNLLLKALEGESKESIDNVNKWFREPALPDLGTNIKCGNSLIDFDIIDHLPDLDSNERNKEMARINPFNWNVEFPDIMKDGGFDAVVGNPPYVRQETLGAQFKVYAKNKFSTYAGTADLYVYFIEQSHKIMKDSGLFGMITSNKFMKAKYGTNLRNFFNDYTKILKIIDFGELPVFQNASTFPAIYLTQKNTVRKQNFIYASVKRLDFSSLNEEVVLIGSELDEKSISGFNWTLTNREEVELIEKIQQLSTPLLEYVEGKYYRGILTGFNEAFLIDSNTKTNIIKRDPHSSELIKPFIVGDDVRKYSIKQKDKFLIFTRRGINIDDYPAIKAHLEIYRENLMPKPENWKGVKWPGRKSGSYQWYEIQDTIKYHEEFEKPKIIFPNIAKEPRFTFDDSKIYSNQKTYIIPQDDKYLLGVLNSKLIWLWLKRICTCLGDPDKGGRLELSAIYMNEVPIRTIDFSNPEDKARHNKMVKLVERMLKLHKNLPDAKTSDQETRIKRQIDATDRQIDELVYELYGLTEDEIKLIEGVE